MHPMSVANDPAPLALTASSPESLVGRRVQARPFFHVEVSESCKASRQAAVCFRATVVEMFGDETVLLEFEGDHPGQARQVFWPRELHAPGCACTACGHLGQEQPVQDTLW